MPLAPILEKMNPLNWRGESRLRKLTDGAQPSADAPDFESSWMASILFGAGATSGVNVTPNTAMGVSTVFACVDVLASAIGTIPLNIYRRLPDGGRELDTTHPLYDLLHNQPNPDMTSVDFRQALQSNLSLRKSAYAVILRSDSGRVVGIYPLENHKVTLCRDKYTRELFYQVQYSNRTESLPATDILHLNGGSFNGFCAPDMLHTVRNVIGLAIALDDNVSKFFKNGSFPGGFLEHPNKLSSEASERLRNSFEQQTGGGNSHRIKVLEEGLKYVAARMANKDAQLDESRDRQAKEIARLFRVPGHKVGIVNNQPRANVEQENLSFVIDTLRPICVTWEQALNQKLLSERERRSYFFEFNLDGLIRGDVKTRYEIYDIGIRNGILSPNECRRKENMNPRDGGDVYLQPLNMASSNGNPTLTTDANADEE